MTKKEARKVALQWAVDSLEMDLENYEGWNGFSDKDYEMLKSEMHKIIYELFQKKDRIKP